MALQLSVPVIYAFVVTVTVTVRGYLCGMMRGMHQYLCVFFLCVLCVGVLFIAQVHAAAKLRLKCTHSALVESFEGLYCSSVMHWLENILF